MPDGPSTRSGGATASVPPPMDTWKAQYGGLEASDIKRLKDLEQENRTLKWLYADMALANTALKDVIAKKLCGLLRDGRSCPTWSHRAAFRFSGPARPPD